MAGEGARVRGPTTRVAVVVQSWPFVDDKLTQFAHSNRFRIRKVLLICVHTNMHIRHSQSRMHIHVDTYLRVQTV